MSNKYEETPLDEMIGLTDAEIEAMADEVEDEEELEQDKDVEGDAKEEEQEEQETIVDEVEPETEPEPIPIVEPFVPEYKATVETAQLEESYKNLDKSLEELSIELADKYEIEELSFTEYQKELRDLNARYNSEVRKLDAMRLKAEIAQEQSQQFSEQKWQWEQDAFFKDHKDFKTDPVLFGALNATLQQMYTDPLNNGKSGLQLLNEAGAKITSRFTGNQQQNLAQDTNIKAKPDKPSTKKPMPELPTTLSNIPAAEQHTEFDNEFDSIDKLGGLEYEAAIARMSEDQRARYFK